MRSLSRASTSRLLPSPAAARFSRWSQPWPLLLTGGAALFAGGMPLELKALALLSCIGLHGLGMGARRKAAVVDLAAPTDAQDSMGAAERWASHRAAVYQMGDTMIEEAARKGEPLTVVMFDQVDLPELHALFGSAASRSLASVFGNRLRQLVGSRGAAVRCSGTTWTVLLPGHDGERALAAVRHALGAGLATEIEVRGEEIVLAPRMAIHAVGKEVAPMLHIYREMRGKIERAHAHELRRQEYLRLERESHSRPSRLAAATGPAPARPRRAPTVSPALAGAATPAM